MKQIALMTCYMGALPNYFGYFTASCKRNPTIQFIVINDSIAKSYTDGNIKFIRMTLAELNAYASEKLNQLVDLKSAWKINELKPLFGDIFSEEFKGFDFWGWCDLDIIWGNITTFMNDELLNKYDVVTTRKNWTTGHFTLFRNTDANNTLYKRHTEIINLLNDSTYYAFEECCHRWNGHLFSFDELRQKGLPLSMFDIVKNAEANGELKACFTEIIREHPQPINYEYKDSRLYDRDNKEEFMYYHLITVKKIWRFYIPPVNEDCDVLTISHRGIRCKKENRLVWELQRLQNSIRGIRKSAANQSFGTLFKKLVKFKRTWV